MEVSAVEGDFIGEIHLHFAGWATWCASDYHCREKKKMVSKVLLNVLPNTENIR